MKLLTIISLALVACSPDADTPLTKLSAPRGESRITVTRIGVIEDDLAYNSRRGIYILKDTITGTEFVGVSGVGISELGSHTVSSGKTSRQVPDER